MAEKIRIDIISDVVCPWCFIGYRQLLKALDMAGMQGDICFHPFELNPDMPPEGEDVAAHIARKYGGTEDESPATWRRIIAIGNTLGIDFTHRSKRIWNTAAAHQLLYWAKDSDHQATLKARLFQAYFEQGENISDPVLLAGLVAEIGLDRAEAAAILADGRFLAPVRELEARWRDMGINGVPAMIIAERALVMGAQEPAQLARALLQLSAGTDGGNSG